MEFVSANSENLQTNFTPLEINVPIIFLYDSQIYYARGDDLQERSRVVFVWEERLIGFAHAIALLNNIYHNISCAARFVTVTTTMAVMFTEGKK